MRELEFGKHAQKKSKDSKLIFQWLEMITKTPVETCFRKLTGGKQDNLIGQTET